MNSAAASELQKPHPVIIKQILVVIGALLLYGVFAGIRANAGLLSMEISSGTGLTYGDAAIAFSVMDLVLAISIPILGILTLKIRMLYLLIFGAIMCGIGFLGTAFAAVPSLLILFLGLIFGIGVSVLSFTIVYSAARQFFSEKGSAILSGFLLAAQGGLGIVLSFVISGVSNTFGITACLIVISIMAFCLIPAAFLMKPGKNKQPSGNTEKPGQPKHEIAPVLKKIFTNPFFYLLFLGSLTYGMGDGILANHLSQIVYLAYNIEDTATFTAAYTFSIMIGAILGGFITAKVKNKALPIGIALVIWTIINILYIIIFNQYMNTGFVNQNLMLTCVYAGIFLNGFLIVITELLIIGLAVEHVSAAVCAVILGLLDIFTYIGYSANSLIGGVVYEFFGELTGIAVIVFVLCVISGIIFFLYGLKIRKDKKIIYL
ncbi:MAG TPA: MFS transporter [Methanocorpusculum sp.]|nr:MFS transporter [Methanocorpusculum sp.]